MEKIILIGLGFWLLAKQGLSKITYFPVGLNFVSITPFSLSVIITIRVENNNNYGLAAKSFSGNLIYMGNQIGRVNIQDQIIIPAYGSTDIQLAAYIELTEAIRSILNSSQGNSIRLVGRLYFEDISIPVKTSFSI